MIFVGGYTSPAEITNFAASSIDMSNSTISAFGKNNKKPDVGFGVVGTKTETIEPFEEFRYAISPFAVVEIKPIAQIPFLGYSIIQAFSKDLSCCANTVSAICLIPE